MRDGDQNRAELPAEWLTLAEACRYLRVSEATMRRLLSRGAIPGAQKIGGLWKFYLPRLREMGAER